MEATTGGKGDFRYLTGKRIKFHDSDEYGKYTGVVTGQIKKEFDAEVAVYKIQIDGFPKPGGWNGQVTAEFRRFEVIE